MQKNNAPTKSAVRVRSHIDPESRDLGDGIGGINPRDGNPPPVSSLKRRRDLNQRNSAEESANLETLSVFNTTLAEILATQKDITGEIYCLESLYPHHHNDKHPIIAYQESSDPDTMYYHEAMLEKDREEFKKAMKMEMKAHLQHGNLKIMHRSKIPEGASILPTVWQMQIKEIF